MCYHGDRFSKSAFRPKDYYCTVLVWTRQEEILSYCIMLSRLSLFRHAFCPAFRVRRWLSEERHVVTDLQRLQYSLDIAALEKENMRWELTVEKKNLELEKKNVELENDRLAAALEKTTDELALVQLNAVHISMRSFLERFLKKCVEVLVNTDRVSARDKKLLKSNSMSAINGVVERHWSLVAAALFPECSCVPRFPRLDKGGLLYGKLSQRWSLQNRAHRAHGPVGKLARLANRPPGTNVPGWNFGWPTPKFPDARPTLLIFRLFFPRLIFPRFSLAYRQRRSTQS